MKKLLKFIPFGIAAFLMASCSGNKQESDSSVEETVETSEEVVEASQPKTINGIVPGAEYEADIEGMKYDLKLFNDGSSTSSRGGEGHWRIESIHDQPFIIVILHEAEDNLYIDSDLNLHASNASTKGYKLERINYIPEDAKGMTVGHKYTMPKLSLYWNRDAYITLNEDGSVTAMFDEWGDMRELNYSKWKKKEIDGKEWIMFFDEVGGFLVSPSLEYYQFSKSDKRIKFSDEGDDITLGDNWQYNREGRLQE